MSKSIKIYKPTEDEILKNVLASFEIENIKISMEEAKALLQKLVTKKSKKGNQ